MKHLRETFPDFAQILTPSIMAEILPIQFKKKLQQHIEQAEQQQKQQQQEALQDKKRMDALIEAQTGERLSADLENRSNAKLDSVRAMVDMSKIKNDAELDRIDRMLKIKELELRKDELRLKSRTEQKKLTGKTKRKAG